jgi:hypothetical protein
MGLSPDEIVQDTDLLALDTQATKHFGPGNRELNDKRGMVVNGWLAAYLESHGYPPYRHRTRWAPDACISQVSSVTTDLTADAQDTTADTIPLGTIFTGADATDALYVMHRSPFAGLYVGVEEAPNAVTVVSSPTMWTGSWTAVNSLVDDTRVGTASFAKGGLIRWRPDPGARAWSPRVFVNTFGYWAKIHVASLTSTTAARQVLPLGTSRLTYPTALYTLGLLYQDAWSSSRGDWADKSERFFAMANEAMERVIGMVADEFDVDQSGAVTPTEVNSFLAADAPLLPWERA